MSSLTEVIEDYINKLFQEEMEEEAFLTTKDLAEFLRLCPESDQLRFKSRFTPERGYIVESQRGGHGYIRIVRICYDVPEEKISHIEDIVGNAVSEQDAKRLLAALQDRELLSARERLVIEVAMRFLDEVASSDFDVSPYKRNALQAEILKRMLRGLALA